ncbi:MAG: hypothetical protein G8237_08495 [Magnetococcales bacterium]|nr:hypothetical protein [Magnetococcales bacterium]NGZ06381.1 hypothetical protein [Magnetococcales bacterium]
MMIVTSPAAVVPASANRAEVSVARDGSAPGFGADYRLDFSNEGLALANSATGIAESKMRNVLTRILLENLFGMEAGSNPHKPDTTQEEMVREVVAEPILTEQLQRMASLAVTA